MSDESDPKDSSASEQGPDGTICEAALKEIEAIVARHHGTLANFVLVVDDCRTEHPISIYTVSCCPTHKKELYDEAIAVVEQKRDALEKAARADTMPPKGEMH